MSLGRGRGWYEVESVVLGSLRREVRKCDDTGVGIGRRNETTDQLR